MTEQVWTNYFARKGGQLYCEELPLAAIGEAVGTPTYVYSQNQLLSQCSRFVRGFSTYETLVCFAVKANSNLTILKRIFASGLGADLVSEGELERALLAGCPPNRVVFSGVGKKVDEIRKGLQKDILMFNVESQFELDLISSVAKDLGKRARISLRLNPNIDAGTHAKIATGLYSTKFGLTEDVVPEILARIKSDESLDLVGLSCHIGSQMTQLRPMVDAAKRMVQLALNIRGQWSSLRYLDLGGGLGIPYQGEVVPKIEDYATSLIKEVSKTGLQLIIEPGRSIVGEAGVLLTRVIGVKKNQQHTFVVLDAAMNDLMRPALYDAYHPVEPVVIDERGGKRQTCQFVGPVCETGDIIGIDRAVFLPKAKDLFAILFSGAYGSSMSSQYNSRPRAAEVMVNGSKMQIIRRREALQDLWGLELDL
jgi:diaminopimelate decarboxylase